MNRRLVAATLALLLGAIAPSQAQEPSGRGGIAAEPLPPPATLGAPAVAPAPPLREPAPPSAPYGAPPAAIAPAIAPPSSATAEPAPVPEPAAADRVFCEQPVSVQVADPAAVAERYRPFIGIWSDASWSPTLCAALIVSSVRPDGTAAIVYVFGPMAANARTAGGILHGTGIIRDGELKFQNSDGSQFAFRPVYADLDGRLTTPKGESYQAIFKKAP